MRERSVLVPELACVTESPDALQSKVRSPEGTLEKVPTLVVVPVFLACRKMPLKLPLEATKRTDKHKGNNIIVSK